MDAESGMKMRIDFVTNSSSCSYLVVCGTVRNALPDVDDLRRDVFRFLREKYRYDEDMLKCEEYVNVFKEKNSDERFGFSIAMGIPYEVSIKEAEEEVKEGLETFGYTVIDVDSEIEERWE
jgi:hypothetical protein